MDAFKLINNNDVYTKSEIRTINEHFNGLLEPYIDIDLIHNVGVEGREIGINSQLISTLLFIEAGAKHNVDAMLEDLGIKVEE
jgi:hypothetical protein